MNPKDQLADIEKGCGTYYKERCGDILFNNTIYLCPFCRTSKKYFLLGLISGLKEEIKWSKSVFKTKYMRKEDIDELTADLKLYEEKLKELEN